MRKSALFLFIAVVSSVTMLCSCDPWSTYIFTVQNKTNDSVLINLRFDKERIDRVNFVSFGSKKYYPLDKNQWQDSMTVVLHKKEKLCVQIGGRPDFDLPPVENITPLWKSIQSIQVEGNELDPEQWDSGEWVYKRRKNFGEVVLYDLKL